jgi:hypothetical protein
MLTMPGVFVMLVMLTVPGVLTVPVAARIPGAPVMLVMLTVPGVLTVPGAARIPGAAVMFIVPVMFAAAGIPFRRKPFAGPIQNKAGSILHAHHRSSRCAWANSIIDLICSSSRE